jgi:hypothetical protein
MSMREHDIEPIPGLPEALPPGEIILWQGSPNARGFALHGFHARKIAVYFAGLLAWCAVSAVTSDDPMQVARDSLLPLIALGPVALGLAVLFGWLVARTTLYTVTNRRVVLRYGIAFPMTLNVPFKVIDGVSFRSYKDGTGDIALSLTPGENIAFLVLWPHVRPWHLKRAEPMLRCLSDAAEAGEILADALSGGPSAPRLAKARPVAIDTDSAIDSLPPTPAAA